ncbi:MAG: universal stress protein [Proteobacteria bacterium]|jgi:nucleotide-binding universal stress UspA family protein|nr:universal stress protein [Pseudomonadota bacterium]
MIKTILVPICHEKGADERIDFAINLATKFDAHVKALHILTPLESMIGAMPMESAYTIEAYSQFQKNAVEEAKKLKAKYEKKLSKSGVRFDWCQEKGDVLSHMYIYSRTSDLTIISQKGDTFDEVLSVMNDFIIGSGLPVIAIPSAGVKKFDGKHILVTWDGGQYSAKATHDALPLLKMAKKVTVLSIAEDAKTQIPAADICAHLSRHGVKAEALTFDKSKSAEKRIIETADELNVDLIVAGAWGHRRLLEIFFGGVTKKLLSNQKRPVFLVH